MQVEALAHGNVDGVDALAMAKILRKSLTGELEEKPASAAEAEDPFLLPAADLPKNTVVLLPEGPQTSVAFDFDMEATNPIEENSAILNVYQTGPYYEDGLNDAC